MIIGIDSLFSFILDDQHATLIGSSKSSISNIYRPSIACGPNVPNLRATSDLQHKYDAYDAATSRNRCKLSTCTLIIWPDQLTYKCLSRRSRGCDHDPTALGLRGSAMASTIHISQYSPPNATAADLWYEICNLDGAMLSAVAYGVHATLFFTCLNALWDQRRKYPTQSYAYTAFIVVSFVLGTIGFACTARFNEMMFVTHRAFPGGPNAFFVAYQAYWVNFLRDTIYIFTAWMQDMLLIWRYFIFWERKLIMLSIPVPLFIISVVMGSLLLAQIGKPGVNVWQSATFPFRTFTIFWAVEITTTIFVTTLIVARLVHMRYRTKKVFGSAQQDPYLSIAAMLVESGLMFSVGGMIFVISYATGNPFQNMVLNVVGQVQSIAPLLIILRVAQGRSVMDQHRTTSAMENRWESKRSLSAIPLEVMDRNAQGQAAGSSSYHDRKYRGDALSILVDEKTVVSRI